MTRPWGPSGVAGYIEHRLAETTKKQIKDVVDYSKKEPKDGYIELFRALERIISQFKRNKKLAEQSSPARVRENLTKSLKLALSLNESFNELDGNSRLLLNQYRDIGKLQGKDLEAIIQALYQAKLDADDYPKRGRNVDNERLYLVLELGHVLSRQIDCPFTTTKVSLFFELLTLVYQEATGNPDIKDVSKLLEAAYHCQRIENPDGTIEYLPRNTI